MSDAQQLTFQYSTGVICGVSYLPSSSLSHLVYRECFSLSVPRLRGIAVGVMCCNSWFRVVQTANARVLSFAGMLATVLEVLVLASKQNLDQVELQEIVIDKVRSADTRIDQLTEGTSS